MIELGDAHKAINQLTELFEQMDKVATTYQMVDSLDDPKKPPKFDMDLEDRIQEIRGQMIDIVSNNELVGAMIAAILNKLPDDQQAVLYCLLRTSWDIAQYNNHNNWTKLEKAFNRNFRKESTQ